MVHAVVRLMAALLMVTEVQAYPSFLTSGANCDRSLTIGTPIMNAPIASWDAQVEDRQHQFTVERDGQVLSCDGSVTVQQGDELVVKVDADLLNAVAASAWEERTGPNYLIEATKERAMVVPMAGAKGVAGCPGPLGGASRTTSAGVHETVIPLSAGALEVRMVSSYAYGTVYLSNVCTFTVAGDQQPVSVSGFVAGNACWEMADHIASDGTSLGVEPWEHSLSGLEACKDSDYALLQETSADSGTFERKYQFDANGNSLLKAHFQQLLDDNADDGDYANDKKDLQYTIIGFVDGTTINVVHVQQCRSPSSCPAYFSPPEPVEKEACVEATTSAPNPVSAPPVAGTTWEYVGFLADMLCGRLEIAPDAANMIRHPEEHSVMCELLPACLRSGYGVLQNIGTGKEREYRVAATFDASGNDFVVALLQSMPQDQDNLKVRIRGTALGVAPPTETPAIAIRGAEEGRHTDEATGVTETWWPPLFNVPLLSLDAIEFCDYEGPDATGHTVAPACRTASILGRLGDKSALVSDGLCMRADSVSVAAEDDFISISMDGCADHATFRDVRRADAETCAVTMSCVSGACESACEQECLDGCGNPLKSGVTGRSTGVCCLDACGNALYDTATGNAHLDACGNPTLDAAGAQACPAAQVGQSEFNWCVDACGNPLEDQCGNPVDQCCIDGCGNPYLHPCGWPLVDSCGNPGKGEAGAVTACDGESWIGANECMGCAAEGCEQECLDGCGNPLMGYRGNANRVHRMCCLDACGNALYDPATGAHLDNCGNPTLDAAGAQACPAAQIGENEVNECVDACGNPLEDQCGNPVDECCIDGCGNPILHGCGWPLVDSCGNPAKGTDAAPETCPATEIGNNQCSSGGMGGGGGGGMSWRRASESRTRKSNKSVTVQAGSRVDAEWKRRIRRSRAASQPRSPPAHQHHLQSRPLLHAHAERREMGSCQMECLDGCGNPLKSRQNTARVAQSCCLDGCGAAQYESTANGGLPFTDACGNPRKNANLDPCDGDYTVGENEVNECVDACGNPLEDQCGNPVDECCIDGCGNPILHGCGWPLVDSCGNPAKGTDAAPETCPATETGANECSEEDCENPQMMAGECQMECLDGCGNPLKSRQNTARVAQSCCLDGCGAAQYESTANGGLPFTDACGNPRKNANLDPCDGDYTVGENEVNECVDACGNPLEDQCGNPVDECCIDGCGNPILHGCGWPLVDSCGNPAKGTDAAPETCPATETGANECMEAVCNSCGMEMVCAMQCLDGCGNPLKSRQNTARVAQSCCLDGCGAAQYESTANGGLPFTDACGNPRKNANLDPCDGDYTVGENEVNECVDACGNPLEDQCGNPVDECCIDGCGNPILHGCGWPLVDSCGNPAKGTDAAPETCPATETGANECRMLPIEDCPCGMKMMCQMECLDGCGNPLKDPNNQARTASTCCLDGCGTPMYNPDGGLAYIDACGNPRTATGQMCTGPNRVGVNQLNECVDACGNPLEDQCGNPVDECCIDGCGNPYLHPCGWPLVDSCGNPGKGEAGAVTGTTCPAVEVGANSCEEQAMSEEECACQEAMVPSAQGGVQCTGLLSPCQLVLGVAPNPQDYEGVPAPAGRRHGHKRAPPLRKPKAARKGRRAAEPSVPAYTPIRRDYSAKIPKMPPTNRVVTELDATHHGVIGIAVNGVPIVHEHPGDADMTMLFDNCGGHGDLDNRYHYHIVPVCLMRMLGGAVPRGSDWWLMPNPEAQWPAAVPPGLEKSPLLGWALDGHPIFGPYNPDTGEIVVPQGGAGGEECTAHALDECNGMQLASGAYAYFLTPTFPFVPPCLMAPVHAEAFVDGGKKDGAVEACPFQGTHPRAGATVCEEKVLAFTDEACPSSADRQAVRHCVEDATQGWLGEPSCPELQATAEAAKQCFVDRGCCQDWDATVAAWVEAYPALASCTLPASGCAELDAEATERTLMLRMQVEASLQQLTPDARKTLRATLAAQLGVALSQVFVTETEEADDDGTTVVRLRTHVQLASAADVSGLLPMLNTPPKRSALTLAIANAVGADTCLIGMEPRPPPEGQSCLAPGLCIDSVTLNAAADMLTIVVSSDDDSWFALGVTTPNGGMTGGGEGSDAFVCSEEGLKRYLMTERANPSAQTEGSVDATLGDDMQLCEFSGGRGRMVFTRTLAASADGEREIERGEMMHLIWSRGPEGVNALAGSAAHREKGSVQLALVQDTSPAAPTVPECTADDCKVTMSFTSTLAMSKAAFEETHRANYIEAVAALADVDKAAVAIGTVTEIAGSARRLLAPTVNVPTTVEADASKAAGSGRALVQGLEGSLQNRGIDLLNLTPLTVEEVPPPPPPPPKLWEDGEIVGLVFGVVGVFALLGALWYMEEYLCAPHKPATPPPTAQVDKDRALQPDIVTAAPYVPPPQSPPQPPAQSPPQLQYQTMPLQPQVQVPYQTMPGHFPMGAGGYPMQQPTPYGAPMFGAPAPMGVPTGASTPMMLQPLYGPGASQQPVYEA